MHWSRSLYKTWSSLLLLLLVFPQIHIIELGPHFDGNCALTNHTEQVNFDDEERYDFPVSVQVQLVKNGTAPELLLPLDLLPLKLGYEDIFLILPCYTNSSDNAGMAVGNDVCIKHLPRCLNWFGVPSIRHGLQIVRLIMIISPRIQS